MIENGKLKTASNIALLAPVPLDHLISAREVLEVEEKVAFGSMAFLVFYELDRQRKGLPVDVYIYASARETNSDAEAFWRARYIGVVPSSNGSHPSGMRFRPNQRQSMLSTTKGTGVFSGR